MCLPGSASPSSDRFCYPGWDGDHRCHNRLGAYQRLHIDRNRELTIYPISVRRVPRRWTLGQEEGEPKVLPNDLRATEPVLIEPPIVLRGA